MWSADILDQRRRILKLVWAGMVKPEEIRSANDKLDGLLKQHTFPGSLT